jgi:hypothetical protein
MNVTALPTPAATPVTIRQKEMRASGKDIRR